MFRLSYTTFRLCYTTLASDGPLPWSNEEEKALAHAWVHVKNADEPPPNALEFWYQVYQQFHFRRQNVRTCYELCGKLRLLKTNTIEFGKIFIHVFNNRQRG
jgi:hypothetical protein